MRVGYAILWLVGTAAAFGLAPPARPDQWAWILRLLGGEWAGENPLVVAHFQLMGIWPIAMAALWRREWWRRGRLPAWPFLLASFGLGCFALLPYAVLRREPELGRPGVWAWVWALLAIGFVGFLAWGLTAGDVQAWVATARTDGFVWPMAWDFALFAVLFAVEARGRLHTVPVAAKLVPPAR